MQDICKNMQIIYKKYTHLAKQYARDMQEICKKYAKIIHNIQTNRLNMQKLSKTYT